MDINGLAQDCGNPIVNTLELNCGNFIANTLELLQSRMKPPVYKGCRKPCYWILVPFCQCFSSWA